MITLTPTYDKITRAVRGELQVDLPEVRSIDLFLFRDDGEGNRTKPEMSISLPVEKNTTFSFANLKPASYVVRANVTTAYQNYTSEALCNEEGLTPDLEIEKYLPDQMIKPCPPDIPEQHEHPDRRELTNDDSILHRDSDRMEVAKCGSQIGVAGKPAVQHLVTMDFSKDAILLGGTGELVYIGGGNRVVTLQDNKEYLQSQNEIVPKSIKLSEGKAKNLLPKFEIANGALVGWTAQGSATIKPTVMFSPLSFAETVRIEAYNFTKESDLAIESQFFQLSDVSPLSINFRAKLELDPDVKSAQVAQLQDIRHFNVTVKFFTEWEEYVGERLFVTEPTSFATFMEFHRVIAAADFPTNGTKAKLQLSVGSLYPGNRLTLSVLLADINQIGTRTTPIRGSSIREGDVYRLQWKDNFSFVQGAILNEFIPRANLPCVLFDSTAFKCSYDGKLTFKTGLTQLETGNVALAWLTPCISLVKKVPTSGTTGDRYFTTEQPYHENEIAEWNGTAWVFTPMNSGECVKIGNKQYVWSGNALLGNTKVKEGNVTITCCYGENINIRKLYLNGIEVASDTGYDPNIESMIDFLNVGCDSNRENQINAEMIAFAIVPTYNPNQHKRMTTLPYAVSQWEHSNG